MADSRGSTFFDRGEIHLTVADRLVLNDQSPYELMRLSIVIPASGQQADIDNTLLSVLENRPNQTEVLLVHDTGYVDPYDLQDELRLIACDESGLLPLLNHGLAAASGDVIHTLCPGTVVSPDWTEAALDAFEEDPDLGSLAPRIRFGSDRKPVRGVNYDVGSGRQLLRRRRRRVTAPLITSGFYRRAALRFLRGFDTQFASFADVELGLRMYSAGYRAISCEEVQIQSCQRALPPAMRGYRAGQLRGQLYRQAQSFGLAGSQTTSLLTEPFRHGLGLGMITGFWGRLRSQSQSTAAIVHAPQGDDQDQPVVPTVKGKKAA